MNKVMTLASLVALGSCGGPKAPAKDTTSATSAPMGDMKGMPGMTDSSSAAKTSVTLARDQIVHGGVRWATLPPAAAGEIVEVPGQIVVNEDRTAHVASQSQARVLAVHVSPGDRVNRGDVLITLQSQDASMARSELAKAQADVVAKRASLSYAVGARDRAQRLLDLKAIPRQDYDRAVSDAEAAQAALTQAEADVARARSVVEQLGVDLTSGDMNLRAPVSGVVTARDVAPGAVVGAGSPLITVTDPSSLWLTVSVPEELASGVRPGAVVRFAVAAYPADTFSARVQSVSAAFDAQTRTLPVRGLITTTRGLLRPEMYAKVWLESARTRNALSVPDSAVQRIDGKSVVFVAKPQADGGVTFERREIEVGGNAGGQTIVTRGVSSSDLVVVNGAFAVKAELAKGKMPKMEM